MTPTATIAAGIRRVRQARNLSLGALAARCAIMGVPRITAAVLTTIERGERGHVGVDELFVLAAALDSSPLELFASTDGPIDFGNVHVDGDQLREWFSGTPLTTTTAA